MGKQQDWYVTACVFLFLSIASIIHCTSQTYIPNHVDQPKRGVDSSHFNVFRRESMPSLKDKDLIEKLPGQPTVSFRQYGGYVSVNETSGRFLYYYFVEAIKPTKSTPLVIWFNGGPGCSSLGSGAFFGLGPFRVNKDGKSLFLNPYSWNNEANVLFLETPAGVGFSYSNTHTDLEEYSMEGDKRTAEDNYAFLVNWLERFPEYKGREIYITGQSYAGHYVPQLAQLILQRNNQNLINLQGIMIGNPGLDTQGEIEGGDKFKLGHGLISQEMLDNKNKLCQEPDGECEKAMQKIEDQIKGLDLYNIYAPVCRNSTLSNKSKKCATIMNVDPCSHNYVNTYFNTKKVQEAIHANTTKTTYMWQRCNDDLTSTWSMTDLDASMIPVLEELIGKGLRVWVYSGDADMAVPFTSTVDVLKKMNLTIVKEWRPWFNEGQVGGYTEDYKGNFKYTTVREAGHSVPRDQPIRALGLFISFIRNTPLPETP
ncbi:Serine carboxypeptidase-like 36 [Cardamine amara subsp. amara]|uniref:Serine carboxypeptidase-like 36 n=1 Tax=Cardamine amara subsp. amara TaxID=228776 RepID=A0ABD1AL38_CARAN